MPASPLLRKLALAAAVPVVLLVLPELALRLLWTPPEPEGQSVGTRRFVEWLEDLSVEARDPGTLYREDPELLWRLQPGAVIETRNYHAANRAKAPEIRISINDDGHRGPPVPAGSERRRVLCMGDSNFFGYPLDDAQTFPAALRAELEARSPGGFEVINGGVPGYTVVQGRRWFDERFAAAEPDVLLLSYLNNDAWRQPFTDAQLIEGARAAWPGLRRKLGQSYLVQFLSSWLRAAPEPADFVPRVPLDQYREGYLGFLQRARERGAEVVVLDYRAYPSYQPYSDTLRALCQEQGVEYGLVSAIIEESKREALRDPVLKGLYDQVRQRWGDAPLRARPHLSHWAEVHPEHLNELGARVLARWVAQTLIE